MDAQTPEKSKRSRKPTAHRERLCHVHDDIKPLDNRDEVCYSVCRDLEVSIYNDKNYCILHLPDNDKNVTAFQRVVDKRFADITIEFARIESDLPENTWGNAKERIRNDFRYVYFPQEFDFSHKTFTGFVNFKSATFAGWTSFRSAVFRNGASFYLAKFLDSSDFRAAKFESDVYFSEASVTGTLDCDLAIFSNKADFSSVNVGKNARFTCAIFNGIANFGSATFTGYADFVETKYSELASFRNAKFMDTSYFISANFNAGADFSLATFNGETKFNKTKFGQLGVTKFFEAKFDKDVIFEETEFNNPVSFNSVLFGKESDIIFRDAFFAQYASFRYSTSEGYLRFINLRQGEENRFNFEEAAFEKASRISFNKVRLRPNWFINIDSRKFSFTNISWENHKASNIELTEELESLEKRKHKEPDNFRLLIIAFRNLATNSEEFNRLEDASNFRQSAFECEKLERKHKQKDWLINVSKTLDKKFICWNFFSETKTIIAELRKSIKHAPFDLVHFLYRLLSFYGESWFRAAWILVAVWFVFGIAYYYLGEFGTTGNECIKFGKSLAYSLFVMTLQKPEPRPFSTITYILYGMETILAPLQAALLALAIRRKFMR